MVLINWPTTTPGSGLPIENRVMTTGMSNTRENRLYTRRPINFPIITSISVTGKLRITSQFDCFFSSEMELMVTTGMKKIKIKTRLLNRLSIDEVFLMKKSEKYNQVVITPKRSKYI